MWFVGRSMTTDDSSKAAVDEIFRYIQAAGQGAFPPARHHPHYLDGPLNGVIHHVVVGWMFPLIPILVWFGLWWVVLGRPRTEAVGGAPDAKQP